VLQLIHDADSILRSRRWKLAHFLASLRCWLLLKPAPTTDPIAGGRERYEFWRRSRTDSDVSGD
jgi:hypothetical protein